MLSQFSLFQSNAKGVSSCLLISWNMCKGSFVFWRFCFCSQPEGENNTDGLNECVWVVTALFMLIEWGVHAMVYLTQNWTALEVSTHELHLLFPLFSPHCPGSAVTCPSIVGSTCLRCSIQRRMTTCCVSLRRVTTGLSNSKNLSGLWLTDSCLKMPLFDTRLNSYIEGKLLIHGNDWTNT